MNTPSSVPSLTPPIDAVVTWVDGNDPAHKVKLEARFGKDVQKHPIGAHPIRFHDSGEIDYCLTSLLKFAPWLRTIFILTDNQVPSIVSALVSTPFADRVRVVDHREVFRGFEEYLPTFNIRSIMTMLWRMPGLADNFLYLNDDFILIQPTQPEDFFQDGNIVVRGRWKRFAVENRARRMLGLIKPLLVNSTPVVQKRASYAKAVELSAQLLGFTRKYFDLPHNPHAWKRSILEGFYREHPEWLRRNASYDLRSSEQFSGEGLMAHLAIKQKKAVLDNYFKTIQLKPGEQSVRRVKAKLAAADANQRFRFACIQSLEKGPELSQSLIVKWLNQRIGSLDFSCVKPYQRRKDAGAFDKRHHQAQIVYQRAA